MPAISPTTWLMPLPSSHHSVPLKAFDPRCHGRTTFQMAEGDAALAQVVGREFERDLVAGQNADVVLAHLASRVGDQRVTVFVGDETERIGQDFPNDAFHLPPFFTG